MTDTDDLLNEAERLHYEVIRDDRDAEWRRLNAEHDLVPALIERVRAAEAEADKFRTLWDRHGKNDLIAERDDARGKLDYIETLTRTGPYVKSKALRAILDGPNPRGRG